MQTSDGLLSFFPHFCIQETAWTIVQHNGSDVTRVRNASPGHPYTGLFEYVASMEQLQAIINRADRCEQELTYYCKKSRLVSRAGGRAGAPALPAGAARTSSRGCHSAGCPGPVLRKRGASPSQPGSHGDAIACRRARPATLSFAHSRGRLWRLLLASVGGPGLLLLSEWAVWSPPKGQAAR